MLGLDDRVGGGALQGAEPREQRFDVVFGGDRDLTVEAGGDLDVVGGEHVGRVGGGDEQRVGVDVADRDSLVAARHRHREERRGGDIDLVDGEVDVVEPVALGGRPGKLVGADRAFGDQQRLGWHRGGPRGLDRRLHRLGSGVAELDQDVGDEAARVAAVQRRRQARGPTRLGAWQRRRGGAARVGDRAQVIA